MLRGEGLALARGVAVEEVAGAHGGLVLVEERRVLGHLAADGGRGRPLLLLGVGHEPLEGVVQVLAVALGAAQGLDLFWKLLDGRAYVCASEPLPTPAEET